MSNLTYAIRGAMPLVVNQRGLESRFQGTRVALWNEPHLPKLSKEPNQHFFRIDPLVEPELS
jgi:hypothetical protein